MAVRFSAPEAEAKYKWLKVILDTFYVSDALLEAHLENLARKGTKPACHKGCHACCLKPTVPFTEPELRAISWYASEVISGELRPVVRQRLLAHDQHLECPFLVDKACSIYPVRPLICRQFLVKEKPCEIGEDVIRLPREGVVRPVAMRLLDHYGFKTQRAKQKAFESGFIVDQARPMHEYNWTHIAKTMDLFEGPA